MHNKTQNLNQNSGQNKNQEQSLKKEPFSLITVKMLLVVLLFAGIGVIIICGVCLIGKYYKDKASNKIAEPINQEVENYYDLLEKKCAGYRCCLRSLKIMKENNYKEVNQNGSCQKSFEKSFLPLKGTRGFCRNSLEWCQPVQTKIISITTNKIKYFVGEQVKITIKN